MSVPEIGVAQLGLPPLFKRLLALQHCVADRRCTIAEGCALLGHSGIIAPTGDTVAFPRQCERKRLWPSASTESVDPFFSRYRFSSPSTAIRKPR